MPKCRYLSHTTPLFFVLCSAISAFALGATPAQAWDAYAAEREKEERTSRDEKEAPQGFGYNLRLAPSLASTPRWGGSSSGFIAEAELLNFPGKSGIGSGFSVGIANYFSVRELVLPMKIHFAYAKKHGVRFSAHGLFLPNFSTDSDSAGLSVGFGGHFAYDFELGGGEDAWLKENDSSWGLGPYIELSTATPIAGDGFGYHDGWTVFGSIGIVARYQ